MPLKPILDKAPLTAMNCHPLSAGLVRIESAAMSSLYSLSVNAQNPADLEGTFRLACVVTGKPGEEPVALKIREMLSSQLEDGSFAMSIKDSVAVLRAAWALYEFEPRKPLLDHIAHWCAYAVQHWEEVMQDDALWGYSADLMELLENLYRVTGKAAVLSLCERVAAQTLSWSSTLNTVNSQRPTRKEMTCESLKQGIQNESDRDGFYHHFYRTNHAESLADGARSTMAKGWYSGSATELNATRNGWERLYRYHGAICGGITSDEMLEGTSPAEAVSTAALGAWAEALCAAAVQDHSEWAFGALERMVFNAMPACIGNKELKAFQCVNALSDIDADKACFMESPDHAARAMTRLVRGYAALASVVVTATADGANVNMYMPGRYAVPQNDDLLVFAVKASAAGAIISVHCKKPVEATVRMRIPEWSRSTEVTVNGTDHFGEVKNGMLTYDRTWHDGDVIRLSFADTLSVADGHHQGKYVLRGPVLMAMPVAGDEWKKAFVSAGIEDNQLTAELVTVKDWKTKAASGVEIPVLPDTIGETVTHILTPYAKTTARIALFPGRKQA